MTREDVAVVRFLQDLKLISGYGIHISQSEIADYYSVSKPYINQIIKNKVCKDIEPMDSSDFLEYFRKQGFVFKDVYDALCHILKEITFKKVS